MIPPVNEVLATRCGTSFPSALRLVKRANERDLQPWCLFLIRVGPPLSSHSAFLSTRQALPKDTSSLGLVACISVSPSSLPSTGLFSPVFVFPLTSDILEGPRNTCRPHPPRCLPSGSAHLPSVSPADAMRPISDSPTLRTRCCRVFAVPSTSLRHSFHQQTHMIILSERCVEWRNEKTILVLPALLSGHAPPHLCLTRQALSKSLRRWFFFAFRSPRCNFFFSRHFAVP
ncbi:hypothetical protein B0H16DRAFT_390025 [Mycena metata]|uniref:Uncharacterized protein n=1 Tax=Mycena metata TaxID=1033252 RepID=A0AAD7HH68_9AGAR|nr:hypothetical protein B0H16DRAFT_390025 [Mycena metata]